ncbi:MAG: hypothetical protein JW990_02095, partial [Thermoleophilia bacterium]|nr:hypothetical protein [Thermoleophilia bacterium]
MELPQLFGSDYVLPAIIAVVLLAAIAGLLMLRKRQNAGAGGNKGRAAAKAEAKVAKPYKGAGFLDGAAGFDEPSLAPDASAAGTAAAAEGSAAMAVAAAGSAAATSVARQAQPVSRHGTSFVTDPLQTVMTSLLQGWGDLTTEDTNRLDVFKRERVIAAIAAVELPKDLKSNEHARTRLAQLRRYAAQLEQGERPPEPETELDEFAAIGISQQAASDKRSLFEAEPVTQASAEMTPAAEAQPEPAPAPRRSSWYAAEDAVESETLETVAEAPMETKAPEAALSSEDAIAAAAAAFWAAPEAEVLETAAAAKAAPVPQAPPAFEGFPMFDESPPSAMRGRISTAADLLTLPADEQTDMLAFLQPAELSKVFSTTSDINLKK